MSGEVMDSIVDRECMRECFTCESCVHLDFYEVPPICEVTKEATSFLHPICEKFEIMRWRPLVGGGG